MKRLARALFAGWLTVFLLAPAITAASDYGYNIQTTYQVAEDGSADVTETVAVTNHTAQPLTNLTLPLSGQADENIQASYGDGGQIVTQYAANPGGNRLTMNFPRAITGAGQSWTFTIRYRADGLAPARGGTRTLFINDPQSGLSDGDGLNLTISVPKDFGTAHFPGAQPASGSDDGIHHIYQYDRNSIGTSPLAIVFGDATVWRLNLNFPLANHSVWPVTQTVVLPPDLNNQHSIVAGLTPAPVNTHVDADGNILADYQLGPNQELNVTTEIDVVVDYLEYDLSSSDKVGAIPPDIVSQYTASSGHWDVGAVKAQADKLTDPSAPVIDNIKKIYDFVSGLNYDPTINTDFAQRFSAGQVLNGGGKISSFNAADLMVSMLRAEGIPARMPVGLAYTSGLKTKDDAADTLSAWVEAYAPGVGWMSLDPVWGKKFDAFGRSDTDHVALLVWGQKEGLPLPVMQGHKDLGYRYAAARYSFLSQAPPSSTAAKLSIRRFVILPFISIDRVKLVAPAGVPSDDDQVTYSGHSIQFGSLAPGQSVESLSLVTGSGWSQGGSATLSGKVADQGLNLASADVAVVWWPLILYAALLVAFAVTWVVVRWRTHHSLFVITEES